MGEDIWGKPLLILGLITLLGGIQLITIGILAEMNMRTYYETGHKKTYQVRRIWNNEEEKYAQQDSRVKELGIRN
jgi:hypothetical protein